MFAAPEDGQRHQLGPHEILGTGAGLDGWCVSGQPRRCSRTHCRFTGPFFLVMAVLVIANSAGTLPLRSYGWAILGGVVVTGNATIWRVSERLLGRYHGRVENGRCSLGPMAALVSISSENQKSSGSTT